MLTIKNILITLAATLVCTHVLAKPIIIDTDLGIDDWQAITYLLAHTRSDFFVGDQLTALLWHKKNICELKLEPVYYTVDNQKFKRLAPQCLNVSINDFTKAYLSGIN